MYPDGCTITVRARGEGPETSLPIARSDLLSKRVLPAITLRTYYMYPSQLIPPCPNARRTGDTREVMFAIGARVQHVPIYIIQFATCPCARVRGQINRGNVGIHPRVHEGEMKISDRNA